MARILITGATGNIGGAIAAAMAPHAARLCLAYASSQSRAEELADRLRASCAGVSTVRKDLSLAGASEELVAEAVATMGGVDVLIHLASSFMRTPLDELTEAQFDEVADANLKAPLFIAKAAAEVMGDAGGSMTFFSDIAAVRPYGGYLPYCMAKAGVEAMVRGLAKSLAPRVRVNAIAPFIVTRPAGMTEKGWNDLIDKTPMRSATSPEEIAALVRWLAIEARTTTGEIVRIDGGRLLR